MKGILACGLVLMAVGPLVGCASIETPGKAGGAVVESDGEPDAAAGTGVRAPAEWEAQAAIWMQWPNERESAMRPAFADIIDVVQRYEPIHLLTSSEPEKAEAEKFLSERRVPGSNITWHIVPVDSAWMRDNGPVYVTNGANLRIQNWRFDAWGGNFGDDVPFESDNLVPDYVAEHLGIASEDHQGYVLERGNLEFNGAGTLVLNWDCQDDRNPGMTRAEHEAILKGAFGVTRIIWAYGHWPQDGTTGHIDGYARFIDVDSIAIADYGKDASETEKKLAAACEEAGLEVIWHPGDVNWLVGNGFVVSGAVGDDAADAKAKSHLESLFPGRDVHLLDVKTIWDGGGGVHCVTNDEPLLE
jgi:agmatine deiminase